MYSPSARSSSEEADPLTGQSASSRPRVRHRHHPAPSRRYSPMGVTCEVHLGYAPRSVLGRVAASCACDLGGWDRPSYAWAWGDLKAAGKRPRPLAVQVRDRPGQWLRDEEFAAAFGIRGRPGHVAGLSPRSHAGRVVTVTTAGPDTGRRRSQGSGASRCPALHARLAYPRVRGAATRPQVPAARIRRNCPLRRSGVTSAAPGAGADRPRDSGLRGTYRVPCGPTGGSRSRRGGSRSAADATDFNSVHVKNYLSAAPSRCTRTARAGTGSVTRAARYGCGYRRAKPARPFPYD